MLCIRAAYAVVRWLSVRPSCCPSRSCIVSKRVITSADLFQTTIVCWRKICANLILASRQGFGELKTEQPGGHSQEQQRHRQAPIDDDDDDYNCLWRMATATPDLRLPSQPKLVLISPTHRGMARLSWPRWLVTYRDSLPAWRRGHRSRH